MKFSISYTPRGLLVFKFPSSTRRAIRRLVGRNSDLYEVFVQTYVALLADSPLSGDGVPLRKLRRFMRTLLTQHPKDTILTFVSYFDKIVQTMNYTSEHTLTGEFLDEMRDTPVFKEYLHFYRTGDPAVFKFLNSFLLFGKKMEFIDPQLEATAFHKWLEIEREMDQAEYRPDLVCALRVIVAQLLPDLDDDVLLPSFGSGYVSEGLRDPNDKLDDLVIDSKLSMMLRLRSFRKGRDEHFWMAFHGHSERQQYSKFKLVYKNLWTMRSICMEPNAYMYFQQEVLRWMVSSMETSPIRRFVDLKDQSRNQRYALAGSYTYSSDTIDLSAASDRVHIDLVRQVFPPKYLRYLLGTRSSNVMLPDKSIVRFNKFAPMGSALCFPVQCVLFSSIVLLSYALDHVGANLTDEIPSEVWSHVHDIDRFARKNMHHDPSIVTRRYVSPVVYGDDIICDSRVTDNVLFLLKHCGLRVNETKSFMGGSRFRESCGVFAFDGEDVTPALFRVKFFQKNYNSAAYASLIQCVNRLGDFGYHKARSLLINTLRTVGVEGFPPGLRHVNFTDDRDEFGIWSSNCQVPSVVRRFNREDFISINSYDNRSGATRTTAFHRNVLRKITPENIERFTVSSKSPSYIREQRDEKSVLVLKTSGGREPAEKADLYWLNQWKRAHIRETSPDKWSGSRISPQVTRVRRGWTPV